LQYLKTQIDTDENTDKHGYISPRIIADFVAVAAQLLLIKSKALLPGIKLTSEEEEKIKDLEGRLLFYKNFKPTISYLKQLSENKKVSISRPLFSGRPAFFYPSENIKIEELHKVIRTIFESLAEIPEKQTIKLSLISLEEKIEEIMKRIKVISTSNLKFQELTAEKSRSEIIVMFLAVLHLLTNQLIRIEQKNRFEEIVIEKR
jgi:segregation and condensation protein A